CPHVDQQISIGPTLFPYTTLFRSNGSGILTRGQLEKLCILTAQRISMLHEFEAPEFYDRTLFRQFIAAMFDTGFISRDDNGCLEDRKSTRLNSTRGHLVCRLLPEK